MIEGAGEVYGLGPEAGHNVFAKYTLSAFDRFRKRREPQMLPAYSIVISSDREVVDAFKRLPENVKKSVGLLGVVPCSVDSIQDLLSSDPKISLLQRAIDSLSNCSECRTLAHDGGPNSAASFLKIEVVIESENAGSAVEQRDEFKKNLLDLGWKVDAWKEGAIPMWDSKTQTGTLEDWKRGNRKTIRRELLSDIQHRVPGALLQLFIESCNGGFIQNPDMRETQHLCYLSATDPRTLLTIPFRRSSIFVPVPTDDFGNALPDEVIKQRRDSSLRNIVEFGGQMWPVFQRYTVKRNEDSDYRQIPAHNGPIFLLTEHLNPLHSFVYNSADDKANRILQHLIEDNVETPLSKQLIEAEFADQLPASLTVSKSQTSPDLIRVLAATTQMRQSYQPYTNDDINELRSREGPLFVDLLKKFRLCAKVNNPEPSSCKPIGDLVRIAAAATKTDSGDSQTALARSLIVGGNEFFKKFDDLDAPTLVTRYEEGRITLTSLFVQLNSLWQEYGFFRSKFLLYANRYYEGEMPAAFIEAFKEMDNDFAQGFFIAQQQFYPLLRKNVLQVRVARIEEAAKLLAIHGHELKGLDAKEELRNLANDLVCLTAFPIGSAFDEKYAKEMKSH